jgi:Family of unknown function (DUF6291)
MKRESFIIRRSYYEPMQKLSKDERGQLLDAVCEFALNGIEPDNLSPIAEMAFNFIGPGIERDYLTYETRAGQSRENGKQGGRPLKKIEEPKNPVGLKVNSENNPETLSVSDSVSASDNKEEKKKKTNVFIHPSFIEVEEYFTYKIKEEGKNLNPTQLAKQFYAYYESIGWLVGKNKMKNWKSTVAGWINRTKEENIPGMQQINGYKLQIEKAL